MLARLVEVGQFGVRVRPLGGDRAGEVRLGRFLHNRRVTPAQMIATAVARAAELVKGRHVLVIQDTTSLRDDGKGHSHQLHAAIAVEAMDGALLGLTSAAFLRRDGAVKAHCNKRSFEEKESRRWLDATVEASALKAAEAACVTVIADCEGDIYDEFALRPATVEVLIRAHHDRALADGGRLYACAEAWPELGRERITLPAAPGRPERDAVLALKAGEVRLKRPKRNRAAEAARLPAEIVLRLVEAREIDPPVGATPAHWRLLTTHVVGGFAQARQITRFYRQRWTIEQLFRVMKTKGFNIEAVRMAAEAPFENLAAATLIAAVQILQMVRARDGKSRRPLEEVFDAADRPALEAVCATLQGRTERQKNPHPKGSLAYASWVCARLGGWTGYYGPPGPVVILQGFLRFKAIHYGWNLRRVV